jgi:uncharacterized NAD-dependent epimerase/dehydratase family protein
MRFICVATITLCTAGIVLAPPSRAADLRSQVQDYRRGHEAAIVGEIDTLTRLKSVAADAAGLAATAQALQSALKARGFDAALLSTGPTSRRPYSVY